MSLHVHRLTGITGIGLLIRNRLADLEETFGVGAILANYESESFRCQLGKFRKLPRQ